MGRLNSLLVACASRPRREDGQALTEYALVLGIIVVGIVVAMAALGTGITGKVGNVVSSLAGVG
jgi:Flp pilus assembly pilin Flp